MTDPATELPPENPPPPSVREGMGIFGRLLSVWVAAATESAGNMFAPQTPPCCVVMQTIRGCAA